ncbi:MAG: RagB/SusD family nutrient uptake outer membrane protein [Gemmatimonadaceae bacterium]|nr:RagB/SusD family nutrient uptake outer membrane protein [Chitinophagaceae bacterium]
MKHKHISKIILSTLIALSIVSCDKRLDVKPKQSIDAATALTTPADVESAIVGCYSVMGGGALYGTNLLMVPELLAQEGYASWRGTFTGLQQAARKTMNRDNGEAARIWNAGYRAINLANSVVDALGIVTDPDQKTQLEGEALFVRGIMHFELVRLFALPWGATPGNTQPGVVIRTRATKTEADVFERTPRSTVAEVYTAVISDLTAAAAKMPEDNGTRADRYTALAFLAKVYLQKGDFANARAAANEVIESDKYEMNASVNAVFDNKNTDESVWEIQQNDQNNAGTSNDGMATFYGSLPGIGRADVRIVPAFLNTYPAGDLRAAQWYYVGTGARPGNIYTSKWKSFSQNLPVIRIAEMYLIRAETNIRLGGAVGDSPANDLAQIRNPVRTNLPVLLAPTLQDVLNERVYELAFEGFRIHEVRRLQQTFTDGSATWAWNNNKLVFPIPQAEVQATEGVITQNPGY